MYPLEKYTFYTNGNKVIAVSTYAGRTVRGVAVCADNDTFDLEKGKELAAARCAVKVAQKRYNRAEAKYCEAKDMLYEAEDYVDRMEDYLDDATDMLEEADEHLENLLGEL